MFIVLISYPNGIDVIETTAIEGTACVLPCVENPGEDFLTSQETAMHFLAFPPRSEWIDIWCILANGTPHY